VSGLLDELSSFLPECPATAQEQLAFYGVVIFSTALWCAGQPWTLGAFILVFAIVVSALAILYGLLGAYKETIAVSLATRMLPAVLGLAWLGLAFFTRGPKYRAALGVCRLGFSIAFAHPSLRINDWVEFCYAGNAGLESSFMENGSSRVRLYFCCT
jgi:hypothetical protein